MKLTEKQKQKICDYIQDALNRVTLQHLLVDDDNGDHLPLVDFLSEGSKDIKNGKEEIINIVDQIYFDMDTWDIEEEKQHKFGGLDLCKLQRKIDESLDKETKESLLKWLKR